MEKEIYSAKVQIRKIGEIRYGKGEIKITDKSVYISYKNSSANPKIHHSKRRNR